MQATASLYDRGLRLSAQGRHLEAIEHFEQALAARPDDAPGNAKVLFALGNTAQALGLAVPAESFFRRVLAAEPGRVEALVNLANLLRSSGQFDAAIALLEPAAAQHPQSREIALTLGSAWREKGEDANAVHWYRAALAIDAAYVPALVNLADLLCDAGARAQARTLYDTALKADPGNAQARINRAILHFLNGDLKDAWRDYAARVDVPGKVPATEQRFVPWTGGALKRVRLLVRAEQGVGDQLLFASLIPDLAARARAEGGSVLLECEPRLAALFARSFPGVTVRPASLKTIQGRVTADYAWLKQAGGATHAVLMGSLPRILRQSQDSFPTPHAFLVTDADERARWRQSFGSGPAIGLCWRSGKSGGHRSVQYAPLAAWGDFLRSLPGTLVSAQYDALPEEIAELEGLSGRHIVVPDFDQKNELDRACAMLGALDALVSAPTAVSWLGAGAGVPTFKILYDTSWTALGRGHEPFAPACVCVMPQSRGDWADVFARARGLVSARL